jgi:hypothetical protein
VRLAARHQQEALSRRSGGIDGRPAPQRSGWSLLARCPSITTVSILICRSPITRRRSPGFKKRWLSDSVIYIRNGFVRQNRKAILRSPFIGYGHSCAKSNDVLFWSRRLGHRKHSVRRKWSIIDAAAVSNEKSPGPAQEHLRNQPWGSAALRADRSCEPQAQSSSSLETFTFTVGGGGSPLRRRCRRSS